MPSMRRDKLLPHLFIIPALLFFTFLDQSVAYSSAISVSGSTLFLNGDIKAGDEYEFQHVLDAQPAGAIKTVALASRGGFLVPAIEIGRTIRRNNLATLVDAGKSMCASACTIIFASGVKRYYLNYAKVQDIQTSHPASGLGFHQGGSALSLDANHQSGHASAMEISAYYEFGVPGGAQLIEKASVSQMYWISGQTALSLGIATSLGSP